MNKYFKGAAYQKGYGLGGAFSKYNQHGYGIGGIFSKFFSFLSPYLQRAKEYALPMLKSGAKVIGTQVVNTASNIAKDLIEGNTINNSAKTRIDEGINNFAENADKILKGRGIKKRKNKFKQHRKKKRVLDIFD